MIGQLKLLGLVRKLISYNALPRFIVLVGEKGQGKKTIATEISKLLKCEMYVPDDLKVDAVRKLIKDTTMLYKPRVYLLADAKNMTRQAQNALLKLAEEPPKNAHIIVTVEQIEDVLLTIKSRASIIKMDRYTKEELKELTDQEDLLLLCDNPGQIEYFKSIDYKALIELSVKVIDNIGKISAANTFNILKHTKPEEYEVFIQVLLNSLGVRLREANSLEEALVYSNLVDVVYEFKKQLDNKSINKQNSLEMMLVKMREVASW